MKKEVRSRQSNSQTKASSLLLIGNEMESLLCLFFVFALYFLSFICSESRCNSEGNPLCQDLVFQSISLQGSKPEIVFLSFFHSFVFFSVATGNFLFVLNGLMLFHVCCCHTCFPGMNMILHNCQNFCLAYCTFLFLL